MLYVERRAKILEILIKAGSVSVGEMVELFNVDATTIRRDLKDLSEKYDIKVVYGGAYFKKEEIHGVVEINQTLKQTENLREKTMIAKKAAALVENGDTIILNNGSTAELVLDHLKNLETINLITESLSIAVKA